MCPTDHAQGHERLDYGNDSIALLKSRLAYQCLTLKSIPVSSGSAAEMDPSQNLKLVPNAWFRSDIHRRSTVKE